MTRTAIVAAVVLIAHAQTALGGSVWVMQGNAQGQGFAFTLGGKCYAYTAGHVLDVNSDSPAVLVDQNAYRAEGRVFKVDARLDVGLIEVPQGATLHRRLCQSAASTPMERINWPDEKTPVPDVWLDRVASPAGGLDRFELTLSPHDAGADFVDVMATAARHQANGNRLPRKGDSGASVWMCDGCTEAHRYTRDGFPNERLRGRLLGMLTSVKGDSARVVRAERLHEFIVNAVQPVVWESIVFEPGHAKVTVRRRGAFPAPNAEDRLPISDSMLDRLAFEIDLGDADTVLEGVTVDLAWTPSANRGTTRSRLRVQTSQYRPGADAKWTNAPCAREPQNPLPMRGPQAASRTCRLPSTRVVRGVRIVFTGNVSALRRVAVLVGR